MVIGIGTDIIEINRIKKSCEDKRFIDRIFTESEQNYCLPKVRYAQHFAARFAAKEACMKALGRGLIFKDIEVLNNREGKPIINLTNKAKELAEYIKVREIFLSISHCNETAVAFVIIEGDEK